MIRTHRRRHRRIFLALALLIPAILLASLVSRGTAPLTAALPEALGLDEPAPGARGATPIVVAEGPLAGNTFSVTRVPATTPGEVSAVILEPLEDPRHPEILVYWTPSAQPELDHLPDEAVLVGTLRGRRPVRLVLPGTPPGTPGGSVLLLYSHAHERLLAALSLPAQDRRPAP